MRINIHSLSVNRFFLWRERPDRWLSVQKKDLGIAAYEFRKTGFYAPDENPDRSWVFADRDHLAGIDPASRVPIGRSLDGILTTLSLVPSVRFHATQPTKQHPTTHAAPIRRGQSPCHLPASLSSPPLSRPQPRSRASRKPCIYRTVAARCRCWATPATMNW